MVQAARSLGVTTFVADHLPHSAAKAWADRPLLISCFDEKALCDVIRKEKIDGILVGCADRLVPVYYRLCKQLGYPCYASDEAIAVLTDKQLFQNKLRSFGLHVTPEYDLDPGQFADIGGQLPYPLYIKPADSNSAKGQSIVRSAEELSAAWDKALSASQSGKVLVEKYMVCDDITVKYMFQNGRVHVVSVNDRQVHPDERTLPALLLFPSKYTQLYLDTVHDRMRSLLESLRIDNGILSLQAFVEGGQILFYDTAYRITGGQAYFFIKEINGLDQLSMLVWFALTGRMNEPDISSLNDLFFKGKCAVNLVFLARTGRIGRIEGLEAARNHPAVINLTQKHMPGDLITEQGTLQQVVCRVHLVTGTRSEMLAVIGEIQQIIQVADDKGQDMLLNRYQVNIAGGMYGG
jgi:hypothetical protein